MRFVSLVDLDGAGRVGIAFRRRADGGGMRLFWEPRHAGLCRWWRHTSGLWRPWGWRWPQPSLHVMGYGAFWRWETMLVWYSIPAEYWAVVAAGWLLAVAGVGLSLWRRGRSGYGRCSLGSRRGGGHGGADAGDVAGTDVRSVDVAGIQPRFAGRHRGVDLVRLSAPSAVRGGLRLFGFRLFPGNTVHSCDRRHDGERPAFVAGSGGFGHWSAGLSDWSAPGALVGNIHARASDQLPGLGFGRPFCRHRQRLRHELQRSLEPGARCNGGRCSGLPGRVLVPGCHGLGRRDRCWNRDLGGGRKTVRSSAGVTGATAMGDGGRGRNGHPYPRRVVGSSAGLDVDLAPAERRPAGRGAGAGGRPDTAGTAAT